LGFRGPKSKIEEKQFCRVPRGELTAKNGSIPSTNKKRRSNLKEHRDRQRYIHTDIQTDRVNVKKNNRLLV